MKKKLLYIVLVWLAGIGAAFGQVTGKVTLIGETDNSGVKIRFVAQSPSGKTDSVYSDSNGKYSKQIIPGYYKMEFSKLNYVTHFYSVLIQTNTSLNDAYLFGQTSYLSGNINGKLLKGKIYIINTDVTIPANDSLVLEPGTKLFIDGLHKIIVKGKLIAIGTNKENIIFSSVSNINSKDSIQKWIGFEGNSTSSIKIDFCEVSNTQIAFKNFLELSVSNSIIKNHINIVSNQSDVDGNTVINNCTIKNVASVFSGGGKNVTISCNNLTFAQKDPSKSYDYSYYLCFSTALNTNMSCNKIDMNEYENLHGDWLNQKVDKNNTYLMKNNYIYNYKFLRHVFQSYEDYKNMNASVKNNTFIGGEYSIYAPSLTGTTPINKIVLNDNIFHSKLSLEAPELTANQPYFNNNILSRQVINFPNQIGFGQKITTNANGDSVDTYFNLFQDPKFLNGNAPYLAVNSPAIGAGIDEKGNPKNIGFNPQFSCFDTTGTNHPIITADTLSIAGLVHQGTSLLSDGVIIAIEKATGKARYQKVSNGVFKIDSLRKSEYILYAVPNPVTVTGYLPTYYVNKVKLSEAISLNLLGKIKDIDIYLVAKPSVASGNSTIQGRFSYADNNTDDTTVFGKNWFGNSNAPASPIVITENPCKNLPVLLYNSNNQLVQSTVTDIDGYFGFQNISSGTYKALGQRVNYSTENSGEVVVAQNSTATANLRLERIVSGIEEESALSGSENVFAYPNPFKDELQLKGYNGKVLIYDLAGNLYFETVLQSNETINSSIWPSGFYLLKTGNKLQKLIKQD